MSHVLSEGYSFPNPVEAALSFILQQSSNKVLWDECQLIWDDQELIEKAPPNGVRRHFKDLTIINSNDLDFG